MEQSRASDSWKAHYRHEMKASGSERERERERERKRAIENQMGSYGRGRAGRSCSSFSAQTHGLGSVFISQIALTRRDQGFRIKHDS